MHASLDKKFRLAILASHPIEYQAPLFKRLAADPLIELTVYFCWDFGVRETYDEGFKRMVQWDVPLLDGYQYIFLKNWSPKPSEHFWGQVNPGIIRELSKNQYDAILVHGYVFASTWLTFLGAWITRTPIILRGETDLRKQVSRLKRVIKRIVLPPLFFAMSAFLYSYQRNKEYYQFYGVPERKLFFLPCAVDNELFEAASLKFSGKAEELKREAGIREPELPTALFVGQLAPRKRVLDLLAAVEYIGQRVRFNTVIVGDGAEAAHIRSVIVERRLERVYFMGFKNQSEVPRFYALADVFVLPSEFDPSPKVVNEAMNFGLAIVATDTSGTIPDLVVASGSGFSYPMGDIHALAGLLSRVMGDAALRDGLKRHARTAVKTWSYDADARGVLMALQYLQAERIVVSTAP